jgi:hypothetical protein
MAGLLDLFNSDDGLLGLSLLAAAAPRRGGGNFGEGLLSAFQNVQQAKAAREDRDMRKQQFGLQQQQTQLALQQAQQQMARDKALQDLPAQFMKPGQMPPTMDARDIGQPGEQGIPRQQFDMAGYANAMYRFDPKTAMALQQSLLKDNTPFVLDEGKLVYGKRPDGTIDFSKPIAGMPKNDQPAAVKEYLYAKTNDGYRGTFEQWSREQANLKAPKTTVNVNAEKPFINSLGENLGKQLDATLSQAKAAQNTIGTANTIRQAIDSGKVISGPGASFRIAGLQIGQALGLGGKDAQETLSQTRTVIQSMARAELDAAQDMKGQGQITEAERDILRRAASGDIDSLTGPEIRLLANTMDKTARLKIQAHGRNVKALGGMPNAAPLMPFYQVDEPAAYSAQQPAGGMPSQDAIAAELARRARGGR